MGMIEGRGVWCHHVTSSPWMDFEAARLLPVLAISEGPLEFRIKVPAQPPSCQDQDQDQDQDQRPSLHDASTDDEMGSERVGWRDGGQARWMASKAAGVRQMVGVEL